MTEQSIPAWEVVKLKDLSERITKGSTPTSYGYPYTTEGIRFIKAENIDSDGIASSTTNYIDSETHQFLKRSILKDNDILFSIAGTIGRVGLLRSADLPANTNQALAIIRLKQGVVHHKYLFHFLRSPAIQKSALKQIVGVGRANLSLENIGEFEIPIAPLDQQKRIVAEIEKQFSRLDEAVANLKRVKVNLKRYKAAVLKAAVEGKLTETWRRQHPETRPASELLQRTEAPPRPNRYSTRSMDVIPGHAALAVGNPGTALPEGWSWSALVDIARMESGHTPSRGHPEWWGGDVAWIGIADAREHHGKLIADTVQHTNDAGLANSAARLLPAGTVCISRTASVGYVVVMARPMATSQDFVNWTPTQAVTSDWLRVVFLADREALIRFGKGSVHKTIYFPEWLSVHIAVPPIAEQNRIVSEVERLLSLADDAEAQVSTNLQRAERLRQSILSRAFSGKPHQVTSAVSAMEMRTHG